MGLITDLTQEYIEKNGRVSAEFSTDKITPEMFNEIKEANKMLEIFSDEYMRLWQVYFCDSCFKHHGFPLHVEIQSTQFKQLNCY